MPKDELLACASLTLCESEEPGEWWPALDWIDGHQDCRLEIAHVDDIRGWQKDRAIEMANERAAQLGLVISGPVEELGFT